MLNTNLLVIPTKKFCFVISHLILIDWNIFRDSQICISVVKITFVRIKFTNGDRGISWESWGASAQISWGSSRFCASYQSLPGTSGTSAGSIVPSLRTSTLGQLPSQEKKPSSEVELSAPRTLMVASSPQLSGRKGWGKHACTVALVSEDRPPSPARSSL